MLLKGPINPGIGGFGGFRVVQISGIQGSPPKARNAILAPQTSSKPEPHLAKGSNPDRNEGHPPPAAAQRRQKPSSMARKHQTLKTV